MTAPVPEPYPGTDTPKTTAKQSAAQYLSANGEVIQRERNESEHNYLVRVIGNLLTQYDTVKTERTNINSDIILLHTELSKACFRLFILEEKSVNHPLTIYSIEGNEYSITTCLTELLNQAKVHCNAAIEKTPKENRSSAAVQYLETLSESLLTAYSDFLKRFCINKSQCADRDLQFSVQGNCLAPNYEKLSDAHLLHLLDTCQTNLIKYSIRSEKLLKALKSAGKACGSVLNVLREIRDETLSARQLHARLKDILTRRKIITEESPDDILTFERQTDLTKGAVKNEQADAYRSVKKPPAKTPAYKSKLRSAKRKKDVISDDGEFSSTPAPRKKRARVCEPDGRGRQKAVSEKPDKVSNVENLEQRILEREIVFEQHDVFNNLDYVILRQALEQNINDRQQLLEASLLKHCKSEVIPELNDNFPGSELATLNFEQVFEVENLTRGLSDCCEILTMTTLNHQREISSHINDVKKTFSKTVKKIISLNDFYQKVKSHRNKMIVEVTAHFSGADAQHSSSWKSAHRKCKKIESAIIKAKKKSKPNEPEQLYYQRYRLWLKLGTDLRKVIQKELMRAFISDDLKEQVVRESSLTEMRTAIKIAYCYIIDYKWFIEYGQSGSPQEQQADIRSDEDRYKFLIHLELKLKQLSALLLESKFDELILTRNFETQISPSLASVPEKSYDGTTTYMHENEGTGDETIDRYSVECEKIDINDIDKDIDIDIDKDIDIDIDIDKEHIESQIQISQSKRKLRKRKPRKN